MRRALNTSLFIGLGLVMGFFCGSARGQIFTIPPIAEAGLRILNGSGPFFVDELGADVHLESGLEDRAIMDFNLGAIPQGSVVASATLMFPLQNQNTDAIRTIDLSTFYGESTVQVGDWNQGVYDQSFGDDYGIHNLDVTSAVQSALNSSQSFLDFRMTAGQYLVRSFIDPNGGSPNTRLTIVLVPEPNALALLGGGVGVAVLIPFFKRRRKQVFTV